MIRSLYLLLLLSLTPAGAMAACALPASAASFGSVTTFVLNTTASTTSTNANVNCGSGSVVSLLSGNSISLQLASAASSNGTRATLTRSGGSATDIIPLRLCTDAACNNELTIGGATYRVGQAQLINLIGLLGGLNFSIPLYLRTVTGQVVTAGTYSGTLNIFVNYNICTGLGVAGLCLSTSQQVGSGTIPVSVTLVVTNDCTTIIAPNISFGSAPLVGNFSSVSQTINVVCSKGSSYSVGLSNGNYASGNVRNMANGANRLSYEIYKGTSNNRWGVSGGERWSSATSTGISSDGLTRSYNYTARILASQNTPPAGNYADSVVVDLAF